MHREKENSSVHGLLVLFRKELADHLRSTRFLLMTALLTLTSMASLYGAFWRFSARWQGLSWALTV